MSQNAFIKAHTDAARMAAQNPGTTIYVWEYNGMVTATTAEPAIKDSRIITRLTYQP